MPSKTEAAPPLLPPAAPQPKDEHCCCPVATVCLCRHCHLPGHSLTGVSPPERGNSTVERLPHGHHLQGQHKRVLISGLFMCCKYKEEPPPYDMTSDKEDLLLLKLRLFTLPPLPPCRNSLTGGAATGTKGKSGSNVGPPTPRRSREDKSGYDVMLRPW
jgi:hypothetical protein